MNPKNYLLLSAILYILETGRVRFMLTTRLPTRELTQPQDMVYVVYPHLNNPAHALSNWEKVAVTFVDVNSFSLLPI